MQPWPVALPGSSLGLQKYTLLASSQANESGVFVSLVGTQRKTSAGNAVVAARRVLVPRRQTMAFWTTDAAANATGPVILRGLMGLGCHGNGMRRRAALLGRGSGAPRHQSQNTLPRPSTSPPEWKARASHRQWACLPARSSSQAGTPEERHMRLRNSRRCETNPLRSANIEAFVTE
jgi:hypothetical protein